MCNKTPVTEFKDSSLSFSYMKTIHHGLLYLTYVIHTLLFSSHAKKNFEIFIFYPFFNFRFPHWGPHLVIFYMGIICVLLPGLPRSPQDWGEGGGVKNESFKILFGMSREK